jgi:RNA-directed DNA polymerase
MPEIDLVSFFTPDTLRQAYLEYKAAKTDRFWPHDITIPMGADGVTWCDFEKNLDTNIANISQRVLGGRYFFYPLLEFEVDKPDGGKRTLSSACIRDALVQRQLYAALYDSAERIFSIPHLHKVSFAYRRRKSAPAAAQRIWRSFKQDGYSWAFDADIRKFFDTLDHKRLMRLVDDWIGNDSLARALVWRFIRTDRVPSDSYPKGREWQAFFKQNKPTRVKRTMGVPQGGVLSGMLANLYLHELDRWVVEKLGRTFDLRYYRYADDFVILTKSKGDAEALFEPIDAKLRELKLVLHPNPPKTNRSAEIAKGELQFVGFHFFADKIRARPSTVQKFKHRFKKEVIGRERQLHSTSSGLLARHKVLVQYAMNPKVRGPEPERCETCGLPKDRHRNWMSFFANTVTDIHQIKGLDRWMRRQVSRHFRKRYKHLEPNQRIKKTDWVRAGAVTLEREYYRQRRIRGKICQCPDDEFPEDERLF